MEVSWRSRGGHVEVTWRSRGGRVVSGSSIAKGQGQWGSRDRLVGAHHLHILLDHGEVERDLSIVRLPLIRRVERRHNHPTRICNAPCGEVRH